MPDDVRSLLKQHLRLTVPPLDMKEIHRRRKRLVWRRRGAACLALAALGAVVWLAMPSRSTGFPHVRSDPSGSVERRPRPRYTSPLVRVAEGTYKGRTWVFEARTAQYQSEQPARDALCIRFNYEGSRVGSGLACLSHGPGFRLSPDYSSVIGGPMGSDFFGAVPSNTARLTLQHENGQLYRGKVFDPARLGVDFKLFVGFAPIPGDTVLLAEDATGEVVMRSRQSWIPYLHLHWAGDGRGGVEFFDRRTRERLFECTPGAQGCSSLELTKYRLILRANPAPGSRFVRWRGACGGSRSCALTVLEPQVDVTAVFERAD